nr:hypothetical protein [uncultured Flavobacterium sp.]
MKKVFILACSILFAQSIYSQENSDTNKNDMYLGPGFGLDYGGIGAKFEYNLTNNINLLAGLGYNFVNLGWNIGAAYNINISNKFSLKPTAMYGYNAALRVEGAPHLDKVSTGATFGLSADLKFNEKGKLNFGLFFPIRSKEFTNHYDMVKNSSYVEMKNSLSSVTFSIGYNFKLN